MGRSWGTADDDGIRFSAFLLVLFIVAVYVGWSYLYPATQTEPQGFRACATSPCSTSGTTP